MRLEVNERIMLVSLLSGRTGKFKDLQKLKRVKGIAQFDEEEIVHMKMAEGQDGVVFDRAEAESFSKEIPLGEWEFNYISGILKDMDRKGQLTEQLIPLYLKFIPTDLDDLPTMSEEMKEKMRQQRAGKKTVAIVGFSPLSCTLAPFGEEGLELWSMNEAHAFKWFKKATRWFQIHDTYKREVANRGVLGHYDWLKKNPWNIPIYMIHAQPEIPKSIDYPIDEICDKYMRKVIRGDEKIRYFNSSFDYILAVACLEGFERVEVYGIDMMHSSEYEKQRTGTHFWLGVAIGQGIELWLPEGNALLKSNQYGGAQQGAGW